MRILALTLAAGIVADALPAQAAVGIYCAASDDVLKLSLESAFSNRDGRKLAHFRGIADVKGDAAPAAFRNLRLNSGMLTQNWMDEDELRLQVYADTGDAKPLEVFDLSIVTMASVKDPDHLTGHYTLTVSRASQNETAPRDVVLSHEAAIFCDVK